MRLKFLRLVALLPRSGCVDEDISHRFVRDRSAIDLALTASETRPFSCVVELYQTSPSTEPPELNERFTPWVATALTERVTDTAVEHRMQDRAHECWGEKISQASGYLVALHYGKDGKTMTSFAHSGNIALFDPQRGIFIAISG